MKKILKKIFIDLIPDEKLEIVYASSVFLFLFFAVRVIIIHEDMSRAYDSQVSNSVNLDFHSHDLKAASENSTEDIILPEEVVLETLEIQESESVPVEESEETTKNIPAAKTIPQAKAKIAKKNVITDGIKAPSLSGSFKKDSQGRKVCSSKSDDPHKSNQNTSIHIDKECCLDPDEIPNPKCYYPEKKYGKLLAKYEKNKAKFLERYRKNH